MSHSKIMILGQNKENTLTSRISPTLPVSRPPRFRRKLIAPKPMHLISISTSNSQNLCSHPTLTQVTRYHGHLEGVQ